MIQLILSSISDWLYNHILIFLLVAGGLFFSVRCKGIQFSFNEQLLVIRERPNNKGEISALQALLVSTASRVGTGNIIGVSTALCIGGFGSVFWMWLIALVGGATAFAEGTLAQIYKKRNESGSYGGSANYIEAAFDRRWLARLFSLLLIFTYGVGFNMLAAYNLQSALVVCTPNTRISAHIIGVALAVSVLLCLLGGGRRILKATSFLVPVMGVSYVLIALLVTTLNITALPQIMLRIFTEAFDFHAIKGGLLGSSLLYGIKRGLFSNEAGVGSAASAAAAAQVSHPVKQGLAQVLSVFIDTLVVCTATAFMCMSSGIEPTAEMAGTPYVQKSLAYSLGNWGPVFISVSLVLFGFTTILGNLFYVDANIATLKRTADTRFFTITKNILSGVVIYLGCIAPAGLLWNIADIAMGLMTIINVPTILFLSKYVARALDDYKKQRDSGTDPVFQTKRIGLPHTVDFWK